MQNQRSLTNFFPKKNIAHKNKASVKEVHCSNDDFLVPEKEWLDNNFQFPIFHHRLLKPSTIVSHRMYRHKNNSTFINLIASATYSLQYLISFPNCDDTTMDCIMVSSESNNLVDGTVNSISGTDIDSETA